ncbi:MAG: hypothetical protein IT428_05715 [Planctomycetaceae bacterium]|nr:hypothetical protein [Planctomycetaceae bacterium]
MGARHKLNKVALQGAMIVGALVGLATDSALIGFLAIGGLMALCVVAGDIRLDRTPRRDRRSRRP